MTALLSSIGILGIILVSIAVLLRITSAKEVVSFIGRAVMVFMLTLVAACILKSLWTGVVIPWLSVAFESLKTLMVWLLLAIAGFFVFALVCRVVFRGFGH